VVSSPRRTISRMGRTMSVTNQYFKAWYTDGKRNRLITVDEVDPRYITYRIYHNLVHEARIRLLIQYVNLISLWRVWHSSSRNTNFSSFQIYYIHNSWSSVVPPTRNTTRKIERKIWSIYKYRIVNWVLNNLLIPPPPAVVTPLSVSFFFKIHWYAPTIIRERSLK
jgi:hypothetical protein